MSEKSTAEASCIVALERSPNERAGFLNEAFADDASLRARIEDLLAAQPKQGGVVDRERSAAVGAMPARQNCEYMQ